MPSNTDHPINPQSLTDELEPGIYAVEQIDEVDLEVWSAAGSAVIALDDHAVVNKQSFLRAIAELFRFPEYFGNNWDAFNDCIRDIEWGTARVYILVYHHSERFALNAPDDWATAMAVFQGAIDEWRQNGRSMYVLLTGSDVDVPQPIGQSNPMVAGKA